MNLSLVKLEKFGISERSFFARVSFSNEESWLRLYGIYFNLLSSRFNSTNEMQLPILSGKN